MTIKFITNIAIMQEHPEVLWPVHFKTCFDFVKNLKCLVFKSSLRSYLKFLDDYKTEELDKSKLKCVLLKSVVLEQN